MTLKEICQNNTTLSYEDISVLEGLEKQLQMISDLTGTDIFIDCQSSDGQVIVVAHAQPSWRVGAYQENVVGQYATIDNEPAVFEAFNTGSQIRDIKAVTQENMNVKQDVVPIQGGDGQCIAVLIRETDITEDIVQEKKYHNLSQRVESLENAEAFHEDSESDIRLREVHHRIKNNLQIVASILNLQARSAKDDYTKGILLEDVGRVLTIASIHDILTEQDIVQEIDCLTLIKRLIGEISSLMGEGKSISISAEGDNLSLTADEAGSVAMCVNELITNSLQHAFEGRDTGEITVSVIEGNLFNTIVVSDNGCGFIPEQCDKSRFGLKIVESTVRDRLHGHLRINSGTGGTKISFDFQTK